MSCNLESFSCGSTPSRTDARDEVGFEAVSDDPFRLVGLLGSWLLDSSPKAALNFELEKEKVYVLDRVSATATLRS